MKLDTNYIVILFRPLFKHVFSVSFLASVHQQVEDLAFLFTSSHALAAYHSRVKDPADLDVCGSKKAFWYGEYLLPSQKTTFV